MRGMMRLCAALDALAEVDQMTLERWRSQLHELFGPRRHYRQRRGVL